MFFPIKLCYFLTYFLFTFLWIPLFDICMLRKVIEKNDPLYTIFWIPFLFLLYFIFIFVDEFRSPPPKILFPLYILAPYRTPLANYDFLLDKGNTTLI